MFGSKLMGFMNWITLLLYLQLLWVIFTVVGLVIGGVFPATFTMFGVIRKWIRDQPDIPMFKTFTQMYKQSFGKANLLGWGTVLVGFSLFYYFDMARNLTGIASTVLVIIIITLTIIYLMTAFFLIPVYVHFDIKVLDIIRHALIIGLSHPFHIVAMALALVAFWYLILYIPALLPFIGISLLAFAWMFIANLAFNRVEQKVNDSK